MHTTPRLSRRRLLALAAASGPAFVLLSACGGAAPQPTAATQAPAAAAQPTVASAAAAQPTAAPAAVQAATAPAQPTAPAKSATQPVTIKFNNRTGKELELFTLISTAFSAKNPNIQVKHESFAGANQEYFQKMAVLIAGGTEGDLVWMSSIEGFYDYAAQNVWLPVTDLVARDKVDLGQWYKAAIDMMSLQGKMYGLPLWSHPSVVGYFYNQDLLDKESIKLPADMTFDQLAGIAQQLTKRSSDGKATQYGYNPARGYYNGTGQVILAFGGDMISKDGTKMTYDEPAVKEALQWMANMDQKYKVTPLPGADDPNQLIVNSKLASWANGIWGYWGASEWKFKWGETLTPKGKGGTHGAMLQTDTSPISKRSKNVDPAWEFHKFMSGPEAGKILLDQNYIPGSRPEIYNSPAAKNNKGLAPFVTALEEAIPLPKPANYRFRELEIAINQVTDNLWLGKMTVDQVTAEVNRAGQAILDKPGGAG